MKNEIMGRIFWHMVAFGFFAISAGFALHIRFTRDDLHILDGGLYVSIAAASTAMLSLYYFLKLVWYFKYLVEEEINELRQKKQAEQALNRRTDLQRTNI